MSNLGRQFQRPAIVQYVRDERQEWADKQSDKDMKDRTHWYLQKRNEDNHTGPDSDECATCQSWYKK